MSLAAFWPQGARAADDPNMDYLYQLAFADNCKQVAPALSKQVDSALAAWQAGIPQDRLAPLRDYARSKQGQRQMKFVGIAITSANGGNKLIASYQCVDKINDWGQPTYPQVSGSQLDSEAGKAIVSSIAPLALARLDCLVLDGVEADAIPAPAQSKEGQAVPTEKWRFSACGRTHVVGIDQRGGRYGLAAKDRIELSGF
ncbi:hypothetical protein [Lysobacter sp. Root983]|uniref:hypothetical protein n=1 Tax=Lysobacter sp. Root983 TaxID=1736613 RepID=UPI00070AA271|nr:hypothetical protein [Lysobacter sp. Root983]KRD75526.1 hypothetical protein ASE43_11670 [Lysobacter sp. Root983]